MARSDTWGMTTHNDYITVQHNKYGSYRTILGCEKAMNLELKRLQPETRDWACIQNSRRNSEKASKLVKLICAMPRSKSAEHKPMTGLVIRQKFSCGNKVDFDKQK